ncbi:MAG: hypothetical protein RML72_02640 [Bacteroidia bacterium]|nr:hypothetical protein [Bacteroidia bacterium]MDW8157758.1 hypothetical protein [Bacteroidia bacterium]
MEILRKKGLLFFFLSLTFLGSGLFLLFIYQQGKQSSLQERRLAINNALKGKIMHSLGSEAKVILENRDINADGLIEAVGILPLKSKVFISKDSFYCKHLEIYHLPGRKMKRLISVEPHTIFDAEDKPIYSFDSPYVGYFCKILYNTPDSLVRFEFIRLDAQERKTNQKFIIFWDVLHKKYSLQLLP